MTQLDPGILREYDIRGNAGVDPENAASPVNLTEADVELIGRAFSTIAQGRGAKKVAVGYDGRLTSPALEAALVKGLSETGLDVVRAGRGPSPMTYFAGATLGVDGALMITGSHNPGHQNGIKMTLGGKSFFGEDIQELGCVAASGDFAKGQGSVSDHPVFDDYVARLLEDYDGGKALRIAWDPGNGAAGEVMSAMLEHLPGEHFVINEEIDGTFPAHHPDPTVEKNLDQLKALVAENDCDLGFGFDGDGDRIGVIDGQGRVLWGDQIMCLLARPVLAEQPGATIIADVKASQVFFDEIARLGGKPLMWKTGHSLIKSKMQETGAPLAGEMSAHIFFKHRYYGYDDALYAAIRLLSVVAGAEESLADMRDGLPSMLNTPEIRVPCPEERKFDIPNEVKARLAGRDGINVNDIDGVRVLSDDGWWLLRASNTQPVLVARCESSTEEGLARLKAAVVAELDACGVAAPEELL